MRTSLVRGLVDKEIAKRRENRRGEKWKKNSYRPIKIERAVTLVML
jgi:hypothetical protein